MPPSFEWEFIEEDSDAPRRIDGGTPAPKWRRWLPRVAVAVALLALAGLLIRGWVMGRLETAEKAEADLRAAVELELKTIADGDAELFRALQDPDDGMWQEQQVARFVGAGAVDSGPAPGLVPAERPWEIRQVHFLGRSGRAELTRWFRQAEGEPTDVLPFLTTWFYRQDGTGAWHHVAPPDDYWGIPYSWHGSRLEIRATKVEAEALDPVARDLALLVVQGCRLIDCPEEWRYRLNFEDRLATQIQSERWAIPALYLTGLPGNAEAQAAWARAMQLWIVEALAQTQVGDRSLVNRVIYRQLVRHLGAELGLVNDPSPDVDLLTEAVRDGERHTLDDLWEATTDAGDPQEARLIDAEVAALLELLKERVGSRRLFRLLPALSEYPRLGNALAALYRIDPHYFESNWAVYLSELTGLPLLVTRTSGQSLPSPPVVIPPPVAPGDEIALICDGRIWVGNVDGSQLVPLTGSEERFNYLYWSPDGHWLLTTWQPDVTGVPGVLYVLAADGSGGRDLPDFPAASVLPLGFSPDGQEAVYAVWRKMATFPMEIRAVDVATGEAQGLPGVPDWSPDGEHLIYITESFGRAWLANGDWENARPIADRAWAAWQGGSWSPDSSQLALQVDEAGRAQSALAVFNLQTERLTTVINSEEFTEALLSSQGEFITDGADPASLKEIALRWLWPFGWSADGSHILIWAHRNDRGSPTRDLSALAAVPLDGSTPQALAYFSGSFLNQAIWSPTNPERLAFTWLPQAGREEPATTFLFDLQDGLLYTGTGGRSAAWSPDGTWVALNGQDGVVIVDEEGQERFTIKPEGAERCSSMAWNPAADPSQLPVTAAFGTPAKGLGQETENER
jgi:WD40 repeat protein